MLSIGRVENRCTCLALSYSEHVKWVFDTDVCRRVWSQGATGFVNPGSVHFLMTRNVNYVLFSSETVNSSTALYITKVPGQIFIFNALTSPKPNFYLHVHLLIILSNVLQDIVDDLKVGIKSTAIKFRENTKTWLTGFSTIMASSLTLVGVMSEQCLPYYAAIGAVSSHLAWQVRIVQNIPFIC